jgi:acetyl coenzyme A synthetase (ADP forming)-like protein
MRESEKSLPDIKVLFEPRSVAVIGASSDPTKIGYKVMENIVSCGYKGRIYPINPKGGEIMGLKAYKSIAEVPEPVDLVSIVIPSKYVYDAVVDCAKNGTKFLTVITSGFSEIGNHDEERRIVSFANDHGMRILGPNIFGIYSANGCLNATFGSKDVLPGHVAIITQSGALGIAMIGKTAIERIGLSAMLSIGNKADIDESDLLEYLIDDPNTRIIMLYMEGITNGERFISVLKRATKLKPVIVLKSGRSKRGAIAAASHTGSLAGSDEIFDKVMKQCHVMRAETLEEGFNWAKYLNDAPLPKGENTVIITNGGGMGVLATDACEKFDVNLLDDLDLMRRIFAEATPEFGSLKNPIDITGGARSSDYDLAIEAALNNDRIDSVLGLYCETAVFDVENLNRMIADNYKRFREKGKPIVFAVIGGKNVSEAIADLQKRGIPVYDETYRAVQVLGYSYKFYRSLNETVIAPEDSRINLPAIEKVIEGVRKDKRTFLLAHEARAVMEAVDIRMPQSRIARNLTEAVEAAEGIGYPVVMKIVSKDIIHKSDAGGVALDLDNREEVIDAYQAVIRNCRSYNQNALIEGVEVAEMVRKGIETIIGARRDRSFGPIIMFGMGGIYVEVMKDVSFRALPLDRREALRMVKETKAYPLLLGVRGEPKKDIDLVIETIIKLGTLIRRCRVISDIEINPLMVYDQGSGAKAVDVRILLTNEGGV